MKFIILLVLVISILLELLAFKIFFSFSITATHIHLVAAVLLAFSSYLFLHLSFKEVAWPFILLMFLFGFFLPLIGFIFAIFLVAMLYGHQKQFYQYAEYKEDVTNLGLLQAVSSTYGAGGAYLKAMQRSASTDERSDALFVLGHSHFSETNKIMYELLGDSSDEIRLLAFKILEQQESFIIDEISLIKDLFGKEEISADAKAKFEKSIAMLYWELAYRYLVFHELELTILKNALDYALKALDLLQDDASLWALLGKIYTRLGDYEKAAAAFAKTTEFNIPLSQTYPYLAAIKFKEGDYLAVKKYLEPEPLQDIALIASVKSFWSAT